MKIDFSTLLVLLMLTFTMTSYGQNDDSRRTFSTVISNYNLPITRNGLSVTGFHLTPRIRIDRREKNSEIILNIEKSQGTPSNPNPNYTYSYNYMGKKYGNEAVGYEPFNTIKADIITYEVRVAYGSKSWTKVVDGMDNTFGPIDKEAKASEVAVYVKVVNINSFNGTNSIENKIRELLKPKINNANTAAANPVSSGGSPRPSGSESSVNAAKTQQAAINNTGRPNPSQPISNSKVASQSTGGSGQLSGKVNVNGNDVQVFQQNGKYYMVNSDGSQHETTKTAFDKVSAVAKSRIETINSAAVQEAKRVEAHWDEQEAKKKEFELNQLAQEQARIAKAARTEQTVQVVTQAASLANELLADWQANRELKWEREKEAEKSHTERINHDRDTYSSFVSNQTNSIFKNVNTQQTMFQSMLPKVLNANQITWEDIIGAPDYNNLFGKDIKSISKKLQIDLPKDKSKIARENLSADFLPKHFNHQNFYTVSGNRTFFYWVKSDFYEHSNEFIFDQNDILIGIQLQLHTSSHPPQKSFPSSLHEYISIQDYYEDLIKNTKGSYFLADGKTLITRDKAFILDFGILTIYDLNFFDANTSFNLLSEFKQYFNSPNCNSCIGKMGIKIQGFRVNEDKNIARVRITEVDKNSAAENAGLLPDDIILNINDVVINFPFHLQWYFLGFPDQKNINLKIERNKKIQTISLTL